MATDSFGCRRNQVPTRRSVWRMLERFAGTVTKNLNLVVTRSFQSSWSRLRKNIENHKSQACTAGVLYKAVPPSPARMGSANQPTKQTNCCSSPTHPLRLPSTTLHDPSGVHSSHPASLPSPHHPPPTTTTTTRPTSTCTPSTDHLHPPPPASLHLPTTRHHGSGIRSGSRQTCVSSRLSCPQHYMLLHMYMLSTTSCKYASSKRV